MSTKNRTETSADVPPADESGADLCELFLSELHSRRERLNYWMRLIREAHDMPASISSLPPHRSHHCRSRSRRRISHRSR